MEHNSLTEVLTHFLARLDSCNKSLLAELNQHYKELKNLVEIQLKQQVQLELSETISLTHSTLNQIGQNSFIYFISEWERKRPYRRALMAIETYYQKISEIVKSLPLEWHISGNELVIELGNQLPKGWQQAFAKLKHKQHYITLRKIIFCALQRNFALSAKLEQKYFFCLIQLVDQLKNNWEITYQAFAHNILKNEAEFDWQKLQNKAKKLIVTLIKEIDLVLLDLEKHFTKANGSLKKAILDNIVFPWQKNAFDYSNRQSANLLHWTKQLQLVQTEVSLENSLYTNELKILSSINTVIESASLERNNLLTELQEAIDWLNQQIKSTSVDSNFPNSKNHITPALSRLAEIEHIFTQGIKEISENLEIPAKFSFSTREGLKIRKINPNKMLVKSFQTNSQKKIALAVKEIETENRKIIHYIEQAREVISFHLDDIFKNNSSSNNQILAQEAFNNALSLLEFCQKESINWRPTVEKQLLQAFINCFSQARIILKQSRLGAFAYLTQQDLRQTVKLLGRKAISFSGLLFTRLLDETRFLIEKFLTYLGLMSNSTAKSIEISTRAFLPQEYSFNLENLDLPALYNRLFRFEPVQDSRFLIGRDKDISAITQARQMWEQGRSISILIIGERGSGKSSLINCAKKVSLTNLEVVQGEFGKRITTEEELNEFLRELFKIDPLANVKAFLKENRRVIILEELERAYLRKVACYGALRALQRLISVTSDTTLWILCVNKTAYQLLDAALGLNQSFSHRIDIGTASKEVLQEAILLRHNLSGLRLEFISPPVQNQFIYKAKSLLGSNTSDETTFFNALEKESAGIFRTAFKLWLGHIDSIQAGLLSVKPLSIAQKSTLTKDLDLADLFTLAAVLQHGSLTYEEYSNIFQQNPNTSRRQIDELVARELLEDDPQKDGFRVSPDALPLVKEVLYLNNLIS